ncbi:MAG: hypothetical protein NUW37_13435 [Planctomycetes bacterium]|nr:hypothetical protein [Planctomycetota bacterium]
MKIIAKTIFALLLGFTVALHLGGCSEKSEHENHEDSSEHEGNHEHDDNGDAHEEPAEASSSETDAKYICPMREEHPTVYDEPGKCPLCDMTLEPVE